MKGTTDKHSDKLNLLLSFLRCEIEGGEALHGESRTMSFR